MKTKGYKTARRKWDVIKNITSCHAYFIMYVKQEDTYLLDIVSYDNYYKNKEHYININMHPLLYYNTLWQKFPSFKKIQNNIQSKINKGLL